MQAMKLNQLDSARRGKLVVKQRNLPPRKVQNAFIFGISAFAIVGGCFYAMHILEIDVLDIFRMVFSPEVWENIFGGLCEKYHYCSILQP